MPKVLWLLEHVCLWVDPLKGVVASPFGEADILYLYLHVQKLCVKYFFSNIGCYDCFFFLSVTGFPYSGVAEFL